MSLWESFVTGVICMFITFFLMGGIYFLMRLFAGAINRFETKANK